MENSKRVSHPYFSGFITAKISENKKALSPVFATLIILAVVTVMFIPVFIWATGVTRQNQDQWQLSGTIATERIVVEEVNLKYDQPNLCSIYVRNIGKTVVVLNNVLITAPSGDIFTYEKNKGEFASINPATGGNQESINQGELLELKITDLRGLPTSAVDGNRGKLFTIKVSTARGVSGEFQIVLEV